MKKLILLSALWLAISNNGQAQLTFTTVTNGLNTIPFQGGDSEIDVGDVDGDGDLDIVTIGDHGAGMGAQAGIMVFLNNGDGTSWTAVKSGNFGYGGVALGDVNNDGKMDVGFGQHHDYGTTDFGDQLMEVVLGDGTGANWTPWDDDLADPNVTGMSWGMFGCDFADVNNDGWLDFGATSFSCCDGLWIYKNDGDGSWSILDGIPMGNVLSSGYCMFGDFNNDGNTDIAASGQGGIVFKNDGQGNFSSLKNGLPADWTQRFDIGDVNNDGAKDIAILGPGTASGGRITVYTFNKNTNVWDSISTGLPAMASGIHGVVLDDMDMDGNCDLAAWSTTGIEVFKGDGTGNFTSAGVTANPISGSYGLRGQATGDFNHDGYMDIASFQNNGANNLKVFLSNRNVIDLGILPDFPKGGECFAAGSVQFLKWLASVPSGPKATVTIEFSSAGPSGPWTSVASNVPNSGYYQWTLPAVVSSNCYLSYTITQSNGTSQVIMSKPFQVGVCSPTTGVEEDMLNTTALSLIPNPADQHTNIHFELTNASRVDISVLDVMGREVLNTLSKELNSGKHVIAMETAYLKPGTYFCKVKAGDTILEKKLVVVR